MKNKVEIKNNIVRKTYSSRMDFVKEENLYKKLKGTGLAPELIDSHDGYLEHEYVQGESFLDLINQTGGEYVQLEGLFEKFFTWYEKYRELTRLTLGQVRFDKFIVSGDRLCNLDFEHTKPGYMEDDFARLISQIYLQGDSYSQKNYDLVRFLIYVATKNIEYNPQLLYDRVKKEIINESSVLGIAVHEGKMEQLATVITSAGIVFAAGDKPLFEIAKDFRLLPRRKLSVTKARGMNGAAIADFERVMTNTKQVSLLERIVDCQKDIKQPWTVCITAEMPRIPEVLWSAILSSDKEDYSAVMIEANGKLREFPILLNNSKTKIELQNALRENEKKSLKEVLSKMNVKIIKVESIRKE